MAGTLNLFSGKWPEKNEASTKTKLTSVQRDWNLVSHFPIDVHNKVQITAEFEETQKLRPKTTINPETRRGKIAREFDIVSNAYTDDNERKQEEDFDRIKADVEQKYWRTHDFDFVKGQYIDGEKEAKYREQRLMLGKVQGASQFRKLPPSIVYSAGNSYNIINQEVTDELKLKVSTSATDRHMNRVKSHEVTQRLCETANLKEEIADEKHKNRVSYQRWSQELDRGYDPIFRNDLTAEHINSVVSVPNRRLRTKNRIEPEHDLGTPGRKLEPPPYVHRPETVWDRIQRDDVNNSTALFNATGSSETLRGMAEAFNKRSAVDKGGNSDRRPKSTAAAVRTGHTSHRPYVNDSPVASGRLMDSGRPPVVVGGGHRDLTKSISTAAAPTTAGGLFRNTTSHNNVQFPQSGRKDDESGRLPNNNGLSVRSGGIPSLKPGRSVPVLDLTRTETPPAVTYNHDTSGPPGQPVAMIRTGGGGFIDY